MDCDTEHKISKYKKTNNFENHLKSKTHLENVKFRVENSTPSRPISAMSIYSAMPPPPLPVHAPPAIPVAGVSDNSSANGGLIESMIANAIQQSIGPLTAHIGNLETRLLSSENIHKHRFEEMARQLDESETRNRELFSQLEECKLSTEELSARLFAAEARSKEQAEISRRLKLVEQANESLQASRSSHSAQLKDAQGSIKALKQVNSALCTRPAEELPKRLTILLRHQFQVLNLPYKIKAVNFSFLVNSMRAQHMIYHVIVNWKKSFAERCYLRWKMNVRN